VKLRVGSRRSKLAVAQCGQICAQLEKRVRDVTCEVVYVETTGDQVVDRPLRDAGGKGLFVKELDEALLAGEIDCAVHSLKDVPTELPDGIRIACVPLRADPRDVLLSMSGLPLDQLPEGALLGTTSLRRQAQSKAINPGLQVQMLRGNIDTRLGRLIKGDFEATFLAAAGLERLRITTDPLHRLELDPFEFIPSPGQGALCFTSRDEAGEVSAALRQVDDDESRAAVDAERSAARVLGGSCHLPVGAYALRRGEDLVVVAMVASPDGDRCIRRHGSGSISAAVEIGTRVGNELLEGGGAEIIAEVEAAAL
jgi:hydroxymethylbilane synthase